MGQSNEPKALIRTRALSMRGPGGWGTPGLCGLQCVEGFFSMLPKQRA